MRARNKTWVRRPYPAAISSSLLLIPGLRGRGSRGAEPSTFCAPFAWLVRNTTARIIVSGVPPNTPNTPGTLGPGREFPFSRGLPLPIGTFGLDRSSVYPVCIPRVRANVFLFPEKEGSGCYRAAHHRSGAFSWCSHATRGGRNVVR